MKTLRARLCLLGTLALAGLPAAADAQPVGSEFQVNTYTTGLQVTGDSNPYYSAGRVIAADATGDFVVVWSGRGQGDVDGIFSQRFDSAGVPVGSEFRVNTTTIDSQEFPAVASDPDGNFVVVWQAPDGGNSAGIFGQRYDSGGEAEGAEFRANSVTLREQRRPAIASNLDGGFVVAWQSDAEIAARRFDSAGNALGAEFRVNSYTRGGQYAPAVASDASGNFVVVWWSNLYNYCCGKFGVFGQRYDGAGTRLGEEFRVSPQGAPPSISSDARGNFVVVWDFVANSGPHDVWGRRYDSGGVPFGPEFRVNTYTTSGQKYPQVASDEDGNFVVVWESSGQEGGQSYGVFGRHFDAAGVPQGQDFQINSHTTGGQRDASIAATNTNEFVAVWTSNPQDGDGKGVFGQRLAFGGAAIAVVSPNTNVKWRIGSLHNIQWTHNLGPKATFRIELDRDEDGDYEELIADDLAVDSATRGSFAWTVTGPLSPAARVLVSWTDDPGGSDSSDVTFQIRPAPLSATDELLER